MKYPHLSAMLTGRPWALERRYLDTMISILTARATGVVASKEEIRAALNAREARQARTRAADNTAGGAVAVIPLYGLITQKSGLITEYSGGCAVTDFVASVRAAVADPMVGSVLIDVDSPGGSVYGIPEAAAELRTLRAQKPIAAICNPIAASAAYWLASACESISCIPSGEAGSIGVYLLHLDESGANAQAGVVPTYVSAGRYKTEGNPDQPLSTDARAYLQSQVDSTYADFVRDVATGRGVSVATVEARFGQGRVLLARDALRAGLIDRIETFDQTIERLSTRSGPGRTRAGLTDREETQRLAVQLRARRAAMVTGASDDDEETDRLRDQMRVRANAMSAAAARQSPQDAA